MKSNKPAVGLLVLVAGCAGVPPLGGPGLEGPPSVPTAQTSAKPLASPAGTPGISQVAHFSLTDQTCEPACVACGPTPGCPTPGCLPRGNASQAYGTTGMAGVPVRVYDPQEYICDGGDHDPTGQSAHRGRPSARRGSIPKTRSRSTSPNGRRSKRPRRTACVCTPRGSAACVKSPVPWRADGTIGVVKIDRPLGPGNVDVNLPSLVAAADVAPIREELVRGPDSFRDQARGVPIEQIVQPLSSENIQQIVANLLLVGPARLEAAELAILERSALAANIWSIDQSVEVDIAAIKPPVLTRDERVEELVVYDFPDAGRLELIKLADRQHAAPGDTVTFTLVMKNVGDSTVRDVSVTDNLMARLQYVADSEKSDREATLIAVRNEVGSQTLTWELAEPLKVGESVTITFEALVR